MRICVITQFFSPDITAAAFRLTESVALLFARGQDVRVITTHPHKALAADSDESLGVDEAMVHRIRITPVGAGGLQGYLRHYLSFMFGAVGKGFALWLKGWRPDIIFATSPPLFAGLAGVLCAKFLRCPIVLDIRDIWPDSAVSAGQLRQGGRAYTIGRRLEKWLYNQVDALTCVSQPMATYLRLHTKVPVHVIYNGILTLEPEVPTTLALPQQRICYAGNFGRVQGLEMLISSFGRLLEDPALKGWEVVLIGAGANEQNLRDQINASPALSNRVRLLPAMSKGAVTRYLMESAVLFLNLKADDVFALTIPSKVFDYMLAARPILFGIVGEGKGILLRTGANSAFEPSDAESFYGAMTEMLNNLSHYQANAPSNRSLVLSEFRRDEQTDRLLGVMQAIVNEASR